MVGVVMADLAPKCLKITDLEARACSLLFSQRNTRAQPSILSTISHPNLVYFLFVDKIVNVLKSYSFSHHHLVFIYFLFHFVGEKKVVDESFST